jgi:protein-S-isoprenylcysteine O-methyltransferase Ste14
MLDTETWHERIQRTKIYDFALALPYVALIVFRLFTWRAIILARTRALFSGTDDLLQCLQALSFLGSVVFSVLLVYLLVARKAPERRSDDGLPRLVAICGTFSVAAFFLADPVALSLQWQFLAASLTLAGTGGSLIAIARLGTSFSLMPEARKLVTTGVYSVVRHPLYLAEMIGVAGLAIQFQQPWACALAAGAFGLQYWRTVFEERVLGEAFPEYAEYATRTSRLIPYVF